MQEVQVIGAGPAGASAAIAALSEGVPVHIVERCLKPRHKVCGEFIPSEIAPILEDLGVWQDFLRRKPARILRSALHFGTRVKKWTLCEPAFGLSRLELDRLILERALCLGARMTRGMNVRIAEISQRSPIVLANGRQGTPPRRDRLFGFKAHFEGPAEETVELHFTKWGYVGVGPVEDHLTNVCGIVPEDILRQFAFEIPELLRAEPALADRVSSLSQCMPWLTTGPLVFSPVRSSLPQSEWTYPAGDALAFVDPFTGSGILNAVLTGRQAGMAGARGTSSAEYTRECRKALRRPLAIARVLRACLNTHLTDMAFLVPGDWLYGLTRSQAMESVSCGGGR